MSDEEFQASSLDDVFNDGTAQEPTINEQPQEVVQETTEEAPKEETAPVVEEALKPENHSSCSSYRRAGKAAGLRATA